MLVSCLYDGLMYGTQFSLSLILLLITCEEAIPFSTMNNLSKGTDFVFNG